MGATLTSEILHSQISRCTHLRCRPRSETGIGALSESGRRSAIEQFVRTDRLDERGAIGKARGLEALNELDTATSFCSGGCERDATGKDCGNERLVLGLMTMRPASIRGREHVGNCCSMAAGGNAGRVLKPQIGDYENAQSRRGFGIQPIGLRRWLILLRIEACRVQLSALAGAVRIGIRAIERIERRRGPMRLCRFHEGALSPSCAPAFRAPGDRVAAERRAKLVAKPAAPRSSTRRNRQNL